MHNTQKAPHSHNSRQRETWSKTTCNRPRQSIPSPRKFQSLTVPRFSVSARAQYANGTPTHITRDKETSSKTTCNRPRQKVASCRKRRKGQHKLVEGYDKHDALHNRLMCPRQNGRLPALWSARSAGPSGVISMRSTSVACCSLPPSSDFKSSNPTTMNLIRARLNHKEPCCKWVQPFRSLPRRAASPIVPSLKKLSHLQESGRPNYGSRSSLCPGYQNSKLET